jgi:septal ring factor EnvC (AmiA/AmiB activator)
MGTTPTVADQVRDALAAEKASEQKTAADREQKLQRWKGEPGAYFREQAEAQDRAWMLRMEQMYRGAEKKTAAEEKHAPELAAITSELAAIDNTETADLERVEREADQVRETAARERAAVKRKRAELTEQIEMDALCVEPGKRFFGFPRRRGAK